MACQPTTNRWNVSDIKVCYSNSRARALEVTSPQAALEVTSHQAGVYPPARRVYPTRGHPCNFSIFERNYKDFEKVVPFVFPCSFTFPCCSTSGSATTTTTTNTRRKLVFSKISIPRPPLTIITSSSTTLSAQIKSQIKNRLCFVVFFFFLVNSMLGNMDQIFGMRMPMKAVVGDTLVRKPNHDNFPTQWESVDTDALLSSDLDCVVLYFSAHYCPPCRKYFISCYRRSRRMNPQDRNPTSASPSTSSSLFPSKNSSSWLEFLFLVSTQTAKMALAL